MSHQTVSDPDRSTGARNDTVGNGPAGGIPLFFLAALLFAVAYLSRLGYLSLSVGRVSLWGVLLLAGLVSAVGGVLAHFFGEETPSSEGGDEEPIPREGGRPIPRATPPPTVPQAVSTPVDEPWRETWHKDEPTLVGEPEPVLWPPEAQSSFAGGTDPSGSDYGTTGVARASTGQASHAGTLRPAGFSRPNESETSDAGVPSDSGFPGPETTNRGRSASEVDSVMAELDALDAALRPSRRFRQRE